MSSPRTWTVGFPLTSGITGTPNLIALFAGPIPLEIVSANLGGTLTSVEILSLGIRRLGSAAAQLVCGALSQSQQGIGNWTSVSAGSFAVTIDGTAENISGLNFANAATLIDVANIITLALRGTAAGSFPISRCFWNGDQFIFRSGIVRNSSVGFLSATGGGTDISSQLHGQSGQAVQLTSNGITPGTGGSPATPAPDLSTYPPASFAARVLDGVSGASTSGVVELKDTGPFNSLLGFDRIYPSDSRPGCGPYEALVFSLDSAPASARAYLGNMKVQELY